MERASCGIASDSISPGETLHIDPVWLSSPSDVEGSALSTFAEQEKRAILDALKRSGGKVYGPGGAAENLGLKPTTLYGKIRKLGIQRGDEKE